MRYPNKRCSPYFKAKYYAFRIAKLAKLLDIKVAANLIKYYMIFPEEIVQDLPMIEAMVDSEFEFANSYISDLLSWYNSKEMGMKERGNDGTGLIPKSDLNIFKKYSSLKAGS